MKKYSVGSSQAGNSPHPNVIQKNLFLWEFPAKNRKARLKVKIEVPWKNHTKEVPMARDSSSAGIIKKKTKHFPTQFARKAILQLLPPKSK